MELIALTLTTDCNFDCEYCLHKKVALKNKRPIEHMTIDIAEKIIEEHKDTLFRIILTGGEPMLRLDLIEILLDRYPQIRFSIQTNGSVVPSDEFFNLCRRNNTEFVVSYDKYGAEVPPIVKAVQRHGLYLDINSVIDYNDVEGSAKLIKFVHNAIRPSKHTIWSDFFDPEINPDTEGWVRDLGWQTGQWMVEEIQAGRFPRIAFIHQLLQPDAAQRRPMSMRYSPLGEEILYNHTVTMIDRTLDTQLLPDNPALQAEEYVGRFTLYNKEAYKHLIPAVYYWLLFHYTITGVIKKEIPYLVKQKKFQAMLKNIQHNEEFSRAKQARDFAAQQEGSS